MCNLHIYLINCSVFINRLTSEIKVHFHVSPFCCKQSSNIPVYFKIVNALKVALLEFIPFVLKEVFWKLKTLIRKYIFVCMCVYHRKEDLFWIVMFKTTLYFNIDVNQF